MATLDFQQYQLQFAGHIRHPQQQAKPAKVPTRRMRVYTQIVFNNLESSVSACFPICKKILGVRAWKRLVRGFFAEHQCTSPLFRKIPEEFLQYLQTVPNLPPYLYSLAHYEWVELAVSVMDAEVDESTIDARADLLDSRPVFAPAIALLNYDYPVHQISPRHKPTQTLAQPVCLLVFRNREDNVRFVELNPVTAQLLEILQTENLTCRQALDRIADGLKHPDPEAVITLGMGVLAELKQQGAILGSRL